MHLMLCLSTLSTLVFVALWGVKTQHSDCWHCRNKAHLVLMLYYWRQRAKKGLMKSLPDCRHCRFKAHPVLIQIWVEHFEYQIRIPDEKPSGLSTLSIQGSSGTDVVLLKTESKERAYVNTVDTKIKACNAFNAMFVDTVDTGVCGSMRCQWRQTRYPTQYTIALLWSFVSTVLTNKIPYSIHNSIALIFCIDCLDMSFNVHTTDKVTVSGFLTILFEVGLTVIQTFIRSEL